MHQPHKNPPDSDLPSLAAIKVKASSPRFPPPTNPLSTETPTAGAQRKIGIAVDLSDESAFAVKWAVHQYLRPGDAVILLHVRPTSVLYGADWGSVDLSIVDADEESQQKLENDFDNFTTTKASDLSQPLVDAHIPFKIHIVKDHDMKERLCLEVERLGLSAVIMGSRGFGAIKHGSDGRLGSVSDYCVRHCVCPVVVVRYPDEKDGGNASAEPVVSVGVALDEEEEPEFHDVTVDRKEWHALQDEPHYGSQVGGNTGSGSSGSKRARESDVRESDVGDSNSVRSIPRPMGREAVDEEWTKFKQFKEKELDRLDKIITQQEKTNKVMKDKNQVKKMKLWMKLSEKKHLDDRSKQLFEMLSVEIFGN